MANNIASQTKNSQLNSFTGGINTDLHPMLQPSNTLTDCVNGTLITYDGNENMLQNDMGNYALKGAKLPVNYVPIGLKEYAGILYIVAYNPVDKRVQIGSYPSPKVNFDASESKSNVTVSPFPIKTCGEDIDIFELVANPQSESGPEYHVYSNLISKANQLMQLLGTMDQTHYQLTVNDQYRLIVTSDNSNDSEWLQRLCFFSVDKEGIIENITDKITKDSEDRDIFHNVVWESAGWIGVKYKLAEIEKCSQSITDVRYPTCDRSINNQWISKPSVEAMPSTPFSLRETTVQWKTNQCTIPSDYTLYENPYVIIEENGSLSKCYWNTMFPSDQNTVIYYCEDNWKLKTSSDVSESKGWKTVKLNQSVEHLLDIFDIYDSDKPLYVFLPQSAFISESEEQLLFSPSSNVHVFIHPNNQREFVFKSHLEFLNLPKNASIIVENGVKELYSELYNHRHEIRGGVDLFVGNIEKGSGLELSTIVSNSILDDTDLNQNRTVYVTGVDSDNWLDEQGGITGYYNSDMTSYILPESWKSRIGSDGYNTYTYTLENKNDLSYLNNHPEFKYLFIGLRNISGSESIYGWRINSSTKTLNITINPDIETLSFLLELKDSNKWFTKAFKPVEKVEVKDVLTNVDWTNKIGEIFFGKKYTGDTLRFVVNSTVRLPVDIWSDFIANNSHPFKWILKLEGETSEKEPLSFTTNESDINIQIKKVGKFYNLDAKYIFDNPIPDSFEKLDIKSVFYCTNAEGKLLILDQTYQQDTIMMPGAVKLNYDDVKILEFKYDVQMAEGTELSKNYTHNVSFDILFNESVDPKDIVYKLIDLSGRRNYQVHEDSGIGCNQAPSFSNVSENVQFAKFSIILKDPITKEEKSLFSEVILINTIVNEFSSKTNMATLPWDTIIDKIISSENNEWKLSISYEENDTGMYFSPCQYEIVGNKIVNWVEGDIPSDIIPIVDDQGNINSYGSLILSDACYAPTSLQIVLGSNIRIGGNTSSLTVHYGDKSRTFFGKNGEPYMIGNSSSSTIPIALCDIKLTANKNVPVKGFPIRERLLKQLYRPVNFDTFMKELGFSEEDIKILDDYWDEKKNNGAIGHLNSNLRFEAVNTGNFKSSSNERDILPNLRDRLPCIFPIKIVNENDNHGVIMPFLSQKEERQQYIQTLINKRGKNADYDDKAKKWWPAYISDAKEFPSQWNWGWTKDDRDIEKVSSVITKHHEMYTFGVLGQDVNKQFWCLSPWFAATSLYNFEHFKKIEKFILWLGLGISKAAFTNINTEKDIYLSNTPEINVSKCSKLICDISNVRYSCGSKTGWLKDLHVDCPLEKDIAVDASMCPTYSSLCTSLDLYNRQLIPHTVDNSVLKDFETLTRWADVEELNAIPVDFNWFPGKPQETWGSNSYYVKYPLFYATDETMDDFFSIRDDRCFCQIDWGRGFDMCKIYRGYLYHDSDKLYTWNNDWTKYETSRRFVSSGNEDNYRHYDNLFVVWPPNMKSIFNQAFDQTPLNNPDIDTDIKKWMLELLDECRYAKDHKFED